MTLSELSASALKPLASEICAECDPCSYLNPKGVIPASATYKKGENPERTRAASTNGVRAPDAEVAAPSDDEDGIGGDDE